MTRLRTNPKIPEGINSSAENPLKEFLWLLGGVLTAIVIAVILFSVLAQWLAPLIPFRWERSVASAYEDSIEAFSDQSEPLTAAAEGLQELGRSLVESESGVDSDIQYHFHLLQEDTPNAFATLGGHIFVTTGLLSVVHSENALAMVMAHEMAHVNHRHPIQALSRGALVQFLLLAVTGGNGAGALNGVLGQTGLLTLLSFSRAMENEADESAQKLVRVRYGHLQGADEFFRAMLDQHGDSRWTEWAQTHPNVAARIERLEQRAGELPADAAVTPLDPRLLQLPTSVSSPQKAQ